MGGRDARDPSLVRVPQPSDPETRERWEHTAKCFRMTTGKWEEDARQFQECFFGKNTRKYLPDPVTSRNPMLTYNKPKAILYDESPVVSISDDEDDGAIELNPEEPLETVTLDLDSIITDDLWPLRQECLLLTLTCNEALMRVDWDDRRQTCRYRIVPAHRVEAFSTPEDPTNPYLVRELRPRMVNNEKVWTWETWDVGPDRKKAEFKIEMVEDERLVDVTEKVMGSTDYPYPAPAGSDEATMPYIMYHSRVTNKLFSPFLNSELVNGTLVVAACWTWWLGGVRDASYPQRVLFNGKVKTSGAQNVNNQRGVEYVETNPLTILQISGEGASIDQYTSAMDPSQMAEAIGAFEMGLATHAGLSAADLQQAGTAGMSGYAIVVSREGLRKAQTKLIPSQRMGDQLLLATAARISNLRGGTTHPIEPSDYLLSYSDIPKSLPEIAADLERFEKLSALDLMDPVDAMLELNPSWTRQQAVAKIIDVMETKAALKKIQRQLSPTTTPPGVCNK